MHRRFTSPALLAWALLPLAGSAAPAPAPPKPDKDVAVSPVQKTREGLDRVVTLKLDRQTLTQVVAQVGEQAELRIVFDAAVFLPFGGSYVRSPIAAQPDLTDVKARAALRTLLAPYALTFVVIGDSVLVTTEPAATARQMAQRVGVHLDKVDLADALKQIAQETGVNLALDPRVEKEASAPVSLEAEDVPLETVVRLLSEMAGLKTVQVGNTLFVTRKEVAAAMRAESETGERQTGFHLDDAVNNTGGHVVFLQVQPYNPRLVSPPDVPSAVPAAPAEAGDK